MIGIISSREKYEIIEEFFQLFKTPWGIYKEFNKYDILIADKDVDISLINSKLIIIYGYEENKFDLECNITLDINREEKQFVFHHLRLPIYKSLAYFSYAVEDSNNNYTLLSKHILKIFIKNKIIFRIGYNLFEEIEFLLDKGQPLEEAHVPTLEHHIELVRKLLIEEKIPFIEVPPVPEGYDFVTCLTHDVDFIKISNHTFDHSYWGFVYRSLFISFKDFLKGYQSFIYVLKCWKALFSLLFIHLGFLKDFWFQFDRYLEIERNLKTTYFFIPFRSKCGDKVQSKNSSYRAAKYNVNDYKELLKYLIKKGNEIGVHGIDSWNSYIKGRRELKRISLLTGSKNLGIRIHWLLHNDQAFRKIEKAGYYYDSTFGYNETVGYRGGTLQVFQPIGVENLLELPLHIQDTALFFSRRSGLCEREASRLCKDVIRNSLLYGGVLTINWHQRSLAPERLWGGFYIKLLKEIQENKVCFATAKDVVKWFKKRRSLKFENVQINDDVLKVKLKGIKSDSLPSLMIRIHYPKNREPKNNDYIDVAIKEKNEINVSLV